MLIPLVAPFQATSLKDDNMKSKLLVLGVLLALAAGCESSQTKKEIADLQARVTANEKAAQDAMTAARSAAQAAQSTNVQGIANAQATADKAMAAANEAN